MRMITCENISILHEKKIILACKPSPTFVWYDVKHAFTYMWHQSAKVGFQGHKTNILLKSDISVRNKLTSVLYFHVCEFNHKHIHFKKCPMLQSYGSEDTCTLIVEPTCVFKNMQMPLSLHISPYFPYVSSFIILIPFIYFYHKWLRNWYTCT